MRVRNPTVGSGAPYEPLRRRSTGSENRNVAPSPGRLSTEIVPAVGLDEAAGDRQPEPGPARVGRLREPVEDVGQERRVDARRRCRGPLTSTDATAVARDVPPSPSTLPPAGVCRRAFATRFASDLADPDRIDVEERHVVGDVDRERRRQPPSRPPRTTRRRRSTRTLEVRRLAVERRGGPPRTGRRVRRSSTSRPRTRVSSRIAPRCSRVRLVDAVEDRLDVALDDRQRRPELVADVGEQRPPLALARLEPGRHRVEAADEVADRARRPGRDGDPRGVVAGLDPLGRDAAARRASTRSTGTARPAPARPRNATTRISSQPRTRATSPSGPAAAITLDDGGDEPDEDDQEHDPEQAAEPAHERAATAAPTADPRALRRPRLVRRPPVGSVLRRPAAAATPARSGAIAAGPRAEPQPRPRGVTAARPRSGSRRRRRSARSAARAGRARACGGCS